MHPSFSLITVVRNNPQVAGAVESILSQEHRGGIESIVIDGASTDGTLQALAPYRDSIAHLVSEPDKGIYDAMNKGLRLASGEIIGLLNADDLYQDTRVFQRVARAFEDPAVDACYGDLVFVRQDDPTRVIRYWRGSLPAPDTFQWGWMPAHPTLFLRRSVYERFGLFDLQYRIAADFEFMLRVLGKHRIRATYIPEVLVRMRIGGASNGSLRGILAANAECRRAFRNLGLPSTPLFMPLKLARHAAQLFRRPPAAQGA
ncbi:MAG TPA: glycosyltransferase family 2 protein [Holophagaceae bacterium]|jgi:glycosyltransferase involved in cell wall biosynthesis|nr:glycosyltransferase family 2 protein [Holophagaceae bacterium]